MVEPPTDWQTDNAFARATLLKYFNLFCLFMIRLGHAWGCVLYKYCNFSSVLAKKKHISTLWHEETSAFFCESLVSYVLTLHWGFGGFSAIFWTGWMWCGLLPVKREKKRAKGSEVRLNCWRRDYHRQVWTAVCILAMQSWHWHDCTNTYNIWLLPKFFPT